jgi:hypothetical protein
VEKDRLEKDRSFREAVLADAARANARIPAFKELLVKYSKLPDTKEYLRDYFEHLKARLIS